MEKTVIVGMSGGVDSAAAAFILKEKGFRVQGIFLDLYEKKDVDKNGDDSIGQEHIDDVKKICDILNITYKISYYREEFKKNVIDYFINSYINGETPNPCVVCNKTIKFEKLLEETKTEKNAFLATGHYADIGFDAGSQRYYIKKGKDEKKDQSYVLYGLKQETLSKTIFPLGKYSKEEIREIAKEAKLPVFDKKDSQDICFIPDGNYVGFIEKYTGKKFEKGPFISSDGKLLGTHNGIIGYTVGQRKGLGIAAETPYYVLRKNIEQNSIVLGREEELYSKRFKIRDLNFMPFETLMSPIKLKVKTRYKQKEKDAILFPIDEKTAEAEFIEEQKAITPGQAAVFYDGDILLGGGIITADS